MEGCMVEVSRGNVVGEDRRCTSEKEPVEAHGPEIFKDTVLVSIYVRFNQSSARKEPFGGEHKGAGRGPHQEDRMIMREIRKAQGISAH